MTVSQRRALAAAARLTAWFADAGTPWVLLAGRLWLGQALLLVHVSMMMNGARLSTALDAGWWARSFLAAASSRPGDVVALACPLLLAAGLMARPAACALLLQILLLSAPGQTAPQTAMWTALLAGVVLLGPGAFSLDRLLAPGLRRSALPGGRHVLEAYGVMTRFGMPLYALGLRVMFAILMVARHAPPESAMSALAKTQLPPAPGLIAFLPGGLEAGMAVLLTVGLGVRPIAIALLILAPLGQLGSVSDPRLFLFILLAILATRGGGVLSLDWLLARSLVSTMSPDAAAHSSIVVIVGGGFAGVAAASGLRDAPCRVMLIDRNNHHVFQPLLYQVATSSLSPADIATPIRAMFRDQKNLTTRLGTVTGVDLEKACVHLGDEQIAYDTLVLATGARHSYFGQDAWERFAPGLKSIEDATSMRRRLLVAFEAAEAAADEAERAAWQTFVIIGGGPTGVELAGAIAELARFSLEGEFRTIDPARSRVILVQSAPVLLPSFPMALSLDAARQLQSLGVELRLNARASGLEKQGLLVDGTFLAARTVLWAAGVMASPAAMWLGIDADRAGRVPVGDRLEVAGHANIFAIGDTASSNGWAGNPVPGLAPAAKQQGAYVARVIGARLHGTRAPHPFRYRHRGNLATIGRKAAVADFGWFRLTGAPAWWLWGAAHVAFLVSGRNRAAVMFGWLWDYLTYQRNIRLITGAAADDE